MDFLDLYCHFTWQPEMDDHEKGLEKLTERFANTATIEDEVDMLCTPLAAYVQCKSEPKLCDEALKTIDNYLSKCEKLKLQDDDDSAAFGYETLGLSNKAFILKEMGRIDEAQKLLKQIKKVDELNDKAKAGIYAVHAFSLGKFGPKHFHKGLELYMKAKKLEKRNYSWHFGFGFLAGRIRRIEEGVQTQPTEMEEESFRTACELSEWKLAVPIVFLAEIIFARGRDFTGGKNTDDKALTDAKRFYKMAYELGPNSPTVLKKCGKGFSILDDEELGIECLQKAIELDPFSSQAHHKLAQSYEFGRKVKNLVLAEKYYSSAVTVSRRRNFFAECDLCRARKKLDVTYNIINHYEAMKIHYLFDPKRIEIINKRIQEAKDYQAKKGMRYNKKPARRY